MGKRNPHQEPDHGSCKSQKICFCITGWILPLRFKPSHLSQTNAYIIQVQVIKNYFLYYGENSGGMNLI